MADQVQPRIAGEQGHKNNRQQVQCVRKGVFAGQEVAEEKPVPRKPRVPKEGFPKEEKPVVKPIGGE